MTRPPSPSRRPGWEIRARYARHILAALCAATGDEPNWAERLLTVELGGEVPGRPIYGVVDDDGGATDQRMRGKVRAR